MQQASTDVGLTPTQISLLQARMKAHNQLKGGASWFWWIAGMSAINALVMLGGGKWNFVIGLGVTQFVNGVAQAIAAKTTSQMGTIVQAIGFLIDVVPISLFVLFGFLAKKGYRWSFIVGMVFYALDGLIFVLVGGWLSLGFHVLALAGLYSGLKAIGKLRSIEQADPIAV
jgi:hypothetical protein